MVKIRAMIVVLMDSRIAQGIWCEICDWTLRPGTSLEQHNSKLVHRTLFDAVAWLAPGKFLEFRDAVTSSSRKKSKFGLKRELWKAASQVSFFLSYHNCQHFFIFLKVVTNTCFPVFHIKSFDRLGRLRQKHRKSSTNFYPLLDKGVLYVIHNVNNSRMLYVGLFVSCFCSNCSSLLEVAKAWLLCVRNSSSARSFDLPKFSSIFSSENLVVNVILSSRFLWSLLYCHGDVTA